jgi:hypothetical protein
MLFYHDRNSLPETVRISLQAFMPSFWRMFAPTPSSKRYPGPPTSDQGADALTIKNQPSLFQPNVTDNEVVNPALTTLETTNGMVQNATSSMAALSGYHWVSAFN